MSNVCESSGAGDKSRNYVENLRILAVDDNPVCLKILSALLKKCCYQFTATKNTEEAYEILKNNKDSYDLILTNVKSNMDGFKLAESIDIEFNIAVVFISANDATESVRKGITIGADYLPKPVRYEDLKLIWKHVARRDDFNKLRAQTEKNIYRNPVPRLLWHKENTIEREAEIKAQVSEKNKKVFPRKPIFIWNPEMHDKFVMAVDKVGIKNAVPMKILELMNDPTLTREIVSSHLQKYRKSLDTQKVNAEKKFQEIQKAINITCSYHNKSSQASISGTDLNSYGVNWMKLKKDYSENENSIYGLNSCFSGGYNPNGGPIPKPMHTNSLTMPPSGSSYGRNLLHSTHIFQTTNSRVMPPLSTAYGIPNQHQIGQHESRNSSDIKRQSMDSFSWDLADLDEIFPYSDIEDEDGIVAMFKSNSAPTLAMINEDATNDNSHGEAKC